MHVFYVWMEVLQNRSNRHGPWSPRGQCAIQQIHLKLQDKKRPIDKHHEHKMTIKSLKQALRERKEKRGDYRHQQH